MGHIAFRSLGYKVEDESFLINNELTHLEPIEIPLPKAPAYNRITGYGKKPEDQFFEYEKMPDTLIRLERELRKKKREENPKEPYLTLEDIREYVSQNSARFKNEIDWIKSQWYYRLNGKWFFINGKPYWLCGWHWFYVNYYKIKDPKVPKTHYRDRDRRWFNAAHYLINEQVENNIGDMVFRHMGINDIECRRQGKTSRVASINLDICTISEDYKGGIQGKDSSNSENVFKTHVVYPFRKLPWFFKPLQSGSTDPAKKLDFKPQSTRFGGKGSVVEEKSGLESEIDWATTANESHYDNEKLSFVHGDEAGKLKQDIFSRHLVLRECCGQGAGTNRNGIMFYTTTVEETESDRKENTNITESIERFRKFSESSRFEKIKGKTTATGLITIFMPAHDGLEGYIDKYGFSLKEKAYEYIFEERKKIEETGHLSAFAKYIRKYPVDYPEIFTPNAEDVYFDRNIISKRIQQLQFDKKWKDCTVEGNFERVDPNNLDSSVRFTPCKEGRFILSLTNLQKYGYMANDFYVKKGERFPRNPRFIASADPFKNNKTKSHGSRISNGGGAVFWIHDEEIDPVTKDIMEWESNRTVCTYEFRPSGKPNMTPKDEYCEDMVMMMEWFGALMYPERNVQDLIDYIEERNRTGYFLYTVKQTRYGKQIEELPGFDTTGDKIKDELFKGMAGYIRIHGERERHIEVLQDCMDINGIADMTHYDRLTSVMGCLKGTKSHYIKVYHNKQNSTKRFSMSSVYGGRR
jgi:hypothetical protein